MPDKFVSKIVTPFGERLIKAAAVTNELMQKIKGEANNVFYATYTRNGPDSGNTSYEDIKAAYDAGKAIYVKYKENASDIGTAELLFALVAFIDHTGTSTPTTLNNFRFQTLEQSTGKTIFRFPSNWSAPYDHTFADSENLWSLKKAIAKDFLFLDFPVAKGTYCTYGYDLYKANQEVTTDTWSDSQWTKVNVMDELSNGDVYVDILQTSFADVLELYNQGSSIVGRLGNEFYQMISNSVYFGDITSFSFQRISGPVVTTWHVANNGPSETNNWVTPPSIYYNAPIYNIATPYDETHTYSVGDIVSRGYGLYRCTTEITTPEIWTSAHWTETSLIDGLATVAKSGDYGDLLNKPTLGTAAAKNVPVSGNAGNNEIVLGNDTRLQKQVVLIDTTATGTDIDDIIQDGKIPMLVVSSGSSAGYYNFVEVNAGGYVFGRVVDSGAIATYTYAGGTWTYASTYKVTSWQGTPDDDHVPSEKLVKDSLDGKAPANDGQSPHDITKFLSADGSWRVPPKSLQYWSGGSTYIKGVYIGTSNLNNGVVSWITGTMSLSNYFASNPNTANGKGIALGSFYLWATRNGNTITASCRLYSLNARHTNNDLMLVYKKDTSDATTYKVHFYVCFGPGTSSGGTSTDQRPFGLGISYIENHNAYIPASLTGITDNIQYDEYYSIHKMPYLAQDAYNVGGIINPVYVNTNGQIAPCNGTVVTTITKSASYTLPSSTATVAVGQIVSIYNSGSSTITVSGIGGNTQTITGNRFRMYYRWGSGATDYCKYGDT